MKKLFTLFSITALTLSASATTYTVTSTADAGAGSFRQAVLDANANAGQDTILFDASTNATPISLTSGVISISESLVVSGNGIVNTILSHDGGGLYAIETAGSWSGGLVKFMNCKINITTGSAGTINFNTSGNQFEIENCLFDGNGQNCTGVKCYNQSQLNVTNSTFQNILNLSISLSAANVNIKNNQFNNCNIGVYDGGAGFVGTIENNTFVNSSYGIVAGSNGQLAIRNNTITGCGSGLILQNGDFIIENNIIFANNNYDVEIMGFSLTITADKNIVGTCEDMSMGSCPTWYSNANPLFDPAGLQDNGGITKTIALQAGSPAINQGNSNAPLMDQRGYLRPDVADIGAYEYSGYTCSLDLSTTLSNTLITANQTSGTYQWYNCDLEANVTGETSQTFQPTTGGNFAVILTDGLCTDTSSCTFINECELYTVSIAQNGADLTISTTIPAPGYTWYNCADTSIILGESSDTFTPTANGSYFVFVQGEFCGDFTNCLTVSNVGLIENNKNNSIQLFPNPAKDMVTIKTDELMSGIKVYSLQGKLMNEQVIYGSSTQLDVTSLLEGIYFVKVKFENNETGVIRMIIAH